MLSSNDPEKIVSEKKLKKDLYAVQYQLLQDVLDITNPGTAIGVFSFDDGFIGLAGLGSSLLGLNTYVVQKIGFGVMLIVISANGRNVHLECAPLASRNNFVDIFIRASILPPICVDSILPSFSVLGLYVFVFVFGFQYSSKNDHRGHNLVVECRVARIKKLLKNVILHWKTCNRDR